MSHAEIVNELEFIEQRTLWLLGQPRDIDGVLACQDYRDECGVLSRRIEELERMLYEMGR